MDRRCFLTATPIALAAPLPRLNGTEVQNDNVNVFGPRTGYTPMMSNLVSMMNWMRGTVMYALDGMTQKDLDYLHDDDSNTIGAMLWHLASTERFYQLNTFENRSWGDWPREEDDKWGMAMSLGRRARAEIKGHDLDFYLEKLEQVREYSLEKMKSLDDDWLMYVDESFGWGPTNNYCKWFHVVEHESNHNGQIKWLASRVAS